MKILQRIFCLLVALSGIHGLSFGQISVAPTSLYIHSDTKIGTLFITNNSEQSQEISINLAFGYPASDDAGNMVMFFDDSIAYEKYALNDWLRVFPRSFVLGPGQNQTVRLQARPVPGLQEGTYWTRVKILSNPQTPEIEQAVTENISTRITFRFEQVIAAFYLNGKTTTGLTVSGIEPIQEGSRLILLADVERTGNSPFIGSIRAEVYDQAGTMVLKQEATTAVYFKALRRLEMDIAGLTPGTYRVKIFFETRRADIAPTDIVQGDAITHELPVTIK